MASDRDHKALLEKIEAYIRQRSEAEFSHGICPECSQRLYPQFHRRRQANKDE